MKLWEIFDSRIELTWHTQGHHEIAYISFEDAPYAIQITLTSFNNIPELQGKRTAEVSFYRVNLPDQQAFATTKSNNVTPTALYGVITNALLDKFSNYDAFFFSAEKKHSSNIEEYNTKVSIYRFLAGRARKKTGARCYEHPTGASLNFFVSKIPIHHSEFVDVVLEGLKHHPVTVIR